MRRHGGRRARAGGLVIVALLAAAVGWAAHVFLYKPWRSAAPVNYALTLTAGSDKGVRHQLAQVIAEQAGPRGVNLKLTDTGGSEAALDAVDKGKLDVALVQGGLSLKDRPNIRQVAALNVEPMHLLVKGEQFEAVSRDFHALKGKEVNISAPGSGTFTLALEILHFMGMRPGANRGTGNYNVSTTPYEELLKAQSADGLPDAVFIVSSLPSPVVRHLVRTLDYRLVPLPFATALALEGQAEGVGVQVSDWGALAAFVRPIEKAHLHEATIPAFAYSVQPAVPPESLRTIGARLLLVAHKDVPPAAVEQMLPALFKTQIANIASPPLDEGVLALPPEAPLHAGTQRFLDRNKPLIAADVLALAEQAGGALSVLGALGGGLLVAWRWWQERRRDSRADRIETYMEQAVAIREGAMRLEEGHDHGPRTLRALLELRGRLDALRAEAFGQLVEGRLATQSLADFFLAEVRETRAYLNTLILRERDAGRERAGEPVGEAV